jgi:hypothetical protein
VSSEKYSKQNVVYKIMKKAETGNDANLSTASALALQSRSEDIQKLAIDANQPIIGKWTQRVVQPKQQLLLQAYDEAVVQQNRPRQTFLSSSAQNTAALYAAEPMTNSVVLPPEIGLLIGTYLDVKSILAVSQLNKATHAAAQAAAKANQGVNILPIIRPQLTMDNVSIGRSYRY